MSTPASDPDNVYGKYRREVADHQVVGSLRAGILIVIGLHLPFLVLDYSFYRENFQPLAIGRTSNAVSLLIVYGLARRWPVPSMLFAVMNAGIHLIVIIGYAGGVSSLYFPGLMLLFLGMPVLLPMTATQAGLVVGSLFACFAGLPLAGFGELGTREYYVNLFFPGAAALECVFSCALLERLRLRDFMRREEIAAARDQLAKLDDAKNRFSANVHHELRTPLTLMIAPLDGLRAGEYGPVSEQARNVLSVMNSNGQRLLKLINDLLDLAKLEDKKFTLAKQRFDLVPILEELVRGTQALAEKKGVRVESRNAAAGEVPVIADRDALDKVLVNLVGNAIKFTNPGGQVSVSCASIDGGVEIEVADSGIGLDESQLVRIFDRFAQVDSSATRKHEGTGIGLSLVSELVGLHGGRIWATSAGLGHGTTMHVFLPTPAAEARDQAIEPATNPEAEAGSTTPARRSTDPRPTSQGPLIQVDRLVEIGISVDRWSDQNEVKAGDSTPMPGAASSRPRVLVTDDNRDMRDLLEFVLSKEFEVETAKNGLEALERIEARPPALVVTDVMMPGLSGTELCERIKSSEKLRDIPVMIVSSKAEGEMKVRGLELGADDYVTKPFHPREVMARARSLVRLREAQAELAERNRELESAFARLSQTQAQLVQSERLAAVGELAAGIAHEVNNPVNYALNAARALKGLGTEIQEVLDRIQQLPFDDRERLFAAASDLRTYLEEVDLPEVSKSVEDVVRIVSDGLERTKKLVGDLRDFARPTEARAMERFDVATGIESTLRLVSREFAEHGIELVRRGPEREVFLVGDYGAINQVVLNLLRNAQQAIQGDSRPREGRQPRIVLEIVEGAEEIEIRVIDNGPGVAPDSIERIFEPFYTTKAPGQGSGLGLSMCRAIVESHRGTLRVSSDPFVETTFSARFPAQGPQGAHPSA